jgi:hypothetical protein
LLGENACDDLVPGTFDWRQLKNKDPYPQGEYGKVHIRRLSNTCRIRRRLG